MVDLANTTTLLSSSEIFTIGEKRPGVGAGLVIRKGRSKVDQEVSIEIKTRTAHKVRDVTKVSSSFHSSTSIPKDSGLGRLGGEGVFS